MNTPTTASGSKDVTTDYDIRAISSALRSLSATQTALKKIDGTAHEMYQRTHKSSTSLEEDSDGGNNDEDSGKIGGLKVAGRMSRNAARVGCIADALFAAELCELAPPAMMDGHDDDDDGEDAKDGIEADGFLYTEDGTLAPWTGRKVVLNTTIHSDPGLAISVLVIYESDYNGGAGIRHGGVDDLLSFAKEEIEEDDEDNDERPNNSTDFGNAQTPPPRGRYLVILSDSSDSDLPSTLAILDTPSERLMLQTRSGDKDSASVCGPLYHMAGKILEAIGPVIIEKHCGSSNCASDEDSSDDDEERDRSADTPDDDISQPAKPAIHFVGYSLAGGVAAMAANIVDGSLPYHRSPNGGKRQPAALCGSGRDRTSALCLGPPPCLSSNLKSDFITSVIHGDDIVCRATHGTVGRLCDRVRKSIKGGRLGRSVGWMSEAVSMTVSGLKSDSKEGTLIVPGKAFLIKPRSMGGGSSSIHEVGGQDRESVRAALLWQLNDVLLSKSLWAHHRLDTYVRSLDKVRLKGFADDTTNEDE